MTEELELYKELQPLFPKDRQIGDRVKWGDCDIEVATYELVKDFNNPDTLQDWKDKWMIFPLPIDPVNPERGLWGMIDWRKWNIAVDGTNSKTFMMDINTPGGGVDIEAATPTLALLKALKAQEGV